MNGAHATEATHLKSDSAQQNDTVLCHWKNINLLLVGCKGNGKSYTGNTILRHPEAFTVTRTGGTKKSSLCSSIHEVDGVSRTVTVVDTPGVSQEMTESEFEQLVRAVEMVPEGFDAICLVWDYKRSDKGEDEPKKEVKVFQSLHRLFGDGLFEHLVILVTHAQQEEIEGFITGLPEAMRDVIEYCPNRVIAIENKLSDSVTVTGYSVVNTIGNKLSMADATERYKADNLSAGCQVSQFDDDKLNLLLVGKVGVGKSRSGNSITGDDSSFKVSDRSVSNTKKCKHFKGKVGNLTMHIVDTPGIDVSDKKSEEIFRNLFHEELRKFEFDTILLVSTKEKYGTVDEEVEKILTSKFGDRFFNHAIMVITGKDQLRSTEEDYIKDPRLKQTLEKCHDRYVFFDNITKDETLRRTQRVKLIKLVQQVKHDNKSRLSIENTIKGNMEQPTRFGWKLKWCSCFSKREHSKNQPKSDDDHD